MHSISFSQLCINCGDGWREQAFQIMEAELGRPIAEVFSSISERPIAAASLGQVSALPAAPAHVRRSYTQGGLARSGDPVWGHVLPGPVTVRL